MNNEQLGEAFAGYRPPTPVTKAKYEKIQKAVADLAWLLQDECPDSREKDRALNDLQGVRMWANAAIAIHTK